VPREWRPPFLLALFDCLLLSHRNSINNAFLPVEVPDLVRDLTGQLGRDKLTVNTDLEMEIDFVSSQLTFNGKTYRFGAVGKAAQELIMEGGLESWIAARARTH